LYGIYILYNNLSVNLATCVAYMDGRTGEGRAAGAGADGRRAQTGCGRRERGRHGAWVTVGGKPQSSVARLWLV